MFVGGWVGSPCPHNTRYVCGWPAGRPLPRLPVLETGFWKLVFGNRFLETGFWKPVFGNRFLENRFLETRFWKTVFWKPVFGKPFFGKPFLENQFLETDFWKTGLLGPCNNCAYFCYTWEMKINVIISLIMG